MSLTSFVARLTVERSARQWVSKAVNAVPVERKLTDAERQLLDDLRARVQKTLRAYDLTVNEGKDLLKIATLAFVHFLRRAGHRFPLGPSFTWLGLATKTLGASKAAPNTKAVEKVLAMVMRIIEERVSSVLDKKGGEDSE